MMVDSSWKNLEHVDHLNHVESVNSSLEGGSEGLVNVGSPGITSPMVCNVNEWDFTFALYQIVQAVNGEGIKFIGI